MKLETRPSKPYQRVLGPSPRFTSSKLVSKPPAPPAVSPKPGSKVFLYVYDSEPEGPGSVPQYSRNPHFTKQSSLEPDAAYPYAKEKRGRSEEANASAPAAQQRSGRQRVRDQGRKGEKGYKVLADVTPQLRSSSRGGKMFIRQKQRMENFTKESQNVNPEDYQSNYGHGEDYMTQGVTDAWPTPWNLATKSATAVKYITARPLAGPMNKQRRGLKDPLGFLPKPPDFWRARVEQNFPGNGPKASPPVRPRSSMRYNSEYAPPIEVNGNSFQRPDSAPPVNSPSYYDSRYENQKYYPNDIYGEYENDDFFRPASLSLPGATIRFNARQYYSAPHRRQGLRRGLNLCTTTPYVQKDFNARAKGWNRAY